MTSQRLQLNEDISGELRYTLCIPVETPSNNTLKGLHFHSYKLMRRQWHMEVRVALKGFRPLTPISRAFLRVTRECCGGGLDWDNAYGGLKPLLDCLVVASVRNPDGLGLIEDDNPKNMPFPPQVKQISGKRGKGSTLLEIFELHPLSLSVPFSA